ncbi:MAG: hypothetical protein V7703_19095 [Hyphomicrobiales bacterium]
MNEKIAENDAKQGRNDKRVLTILVAGIALCLIAFGMIEFFQGTLDTNS